MFVKSTNLAVLFGLLAYLSGDVLARPAEEVDKHVVSDTSIIPGRRETPRDGATVRLLKPSGDQWFGNKVEGAAVDKDGNFYAVDFGPISAKATRAINTIGRIDVITKAASLFYTDSDNTTYINGVRFVKPTGNSPKGGRALLADVNNHRVLQLSWTSDAMPKVITLGEGGNAQRSVFCEDARMLQPNDLAVSKDGCHVYLTGQVVDDKVKPPQGKGDLWHCGCDGKATQLATMGRTNGVEVSPDGKRLYVTEAVGGWDPIESKIWYYELNESTGLPKGDKQLFHDATPKKGNAFDFDGMRTDTSGLLFATSNGDSAVIQLNPDGTPGPRYPLPFKNPTNLDLAGPGGILMYVVGPCPGSDPQIEVGCVAEISGFSAGLPMLSSSSGTSFNVSFAIFYCLLSACSYLSLA